MRSAKPMVAADLDLVNMFGNVECPTIRASIQAHFAEASACTCWQHQQPSVTTLTSGVEVATDRGAEQGDVSAQLKALPRLVARGPSISHAFLVPLQIQIPCPRIFLKHKCEST